MSDAFFFVTASLFAAVAIALALMWPQGLGTTSPRPFGHPVTPELSAPAPSRPAALPQLTPLPVPDLGQPGPAAPQASAPAPAAPQLKGAL